MVRSLTLALVLGLAAQAAMAVQIDSVLLPNAPVKAAGPRALRLAESVAVPPLASLRAASVGAVDQLEAIAAWNRSGSRPAKNGFARSSKTVQTPSCCSMRKDGLRIRRCPRSGTSDGRSRTSSDARCSTFCILTIAASSVLASPTCCSIRACRCCPAGRRW